MKNKKILEIFQVRFNIACSEIKVCKYKCSQAGKGYILSNGIIIPPGCIDKVGMDDVFGDVAWTFNRDLLSKYVSEVKESRISRLDKQIKHIEELLKSVSRVNIDIDQIEVREM